MLICLAPALAPAAEGPALAPAAEGPGHRLRAAPVALQAGIVASLTALLRSAASRSAAGDRSSPGSSGEGAGSTAARAAAAATWRKVLRGVGAEALAPEVLRLGAALHRIASVSSAVAGTAVYSPLLAALQVAAPVWQRRRH